LEGWIGTRLIKFREKGRKAEVVVGRAAPVRSGFGPVPPVNKVSAYKIVIPEPEISGMVRKAEKQKAFSFYTGYIAIAVRGTGPNASSVTRFGMSLA
jgi:hypothetical protein